MCTMTPLFSPRLGRRVLLVLLGLFCLHVFAAAAVASGPAVETIATTPFLQANFVYDLVADRARMVQVSLVFVTLGCVLIWWYR
jgi:hypothetical protein